jgi:hypothetical protein
LTSSALAARRVVGAQRPRVHSFPKFGSSAGEEVIELADMAGLVLDDWQQFVLVNSLGEKADGRWAAFEVGVNVARQNGKGGILEARELAGLFLFDERLLIHSAHQFDTSEEAFRRFESLIEGCDEFTKRVKKISHAHGQEGIELYGPPGRRRTGGQRIRYRTRTKGGGRGFTGDLIVFDEAMILPESSLSAVLPIVSARPNPQVWYTGSAVDQTIHDDGLVFARVRARGHAGDDPALAYFEWSVEVVDDDGIPLDPDAIPDDVTLDPRAWAQANPALGIRISLEHVENEWRSMGNGGRSFAVERLGIGDWPATTGEVYVINPEQWADLIDTKSKAVAPVSLAFDVTPDRKRAVICVAGDRDDSLYHLEVIDHRPGTGWLPTRLKALDDRHRPACIVYDERSPAASLVPEIEKLGVTVTSLSMKELVAGCGLMFDSVEQHAARHLGQRELAAAIRGATKRTLGDAWAWDRKNSDADISPLVACTLALWGLVGSRANAWASGW